jgi:hypothetical protein
MMDMQWTDTDPATGGRRFVSAEHFAGRWRFRYRLHRRHDWTPGLEPTREIWEVVLDGLRRRYQRREGVDESDVKQVERILAEWREPPSLGGE